MDTIVIRYNGNLYTIVKSPLELDEHAWDRAWFLVKHTPDTMGWNERVSRSHMWANKKYLGIEYENVDKI